MAATLFKKTIGDLAADRGLSEDDLTRSVKELEANLPKTQSGTSYATRGQIAVLVDRWLPPELRAFNTDFTDALVAFIGTEHGKGAVPSLGVDQDYKTSGASQPASA